MKRSLRYIVLAMAAVAALTTGAQANVILFQQGADLPPSNQDALDFLEAATGDTLTELFKAEPSGTSGTCPSGPDCFSVTVNATTPPSATVFWADTSDPVNWVLIVDGDGNLCGGTGTGKCYSLYSVEADQVFNSDGNEIVALPTGSGGVSHVTFFTAGVTPPGVPEPSLFILLGTGLLGTLAVARRLM